MRGRILPVTAALVALAAARPRPALAAGDACSADAQRLCRGGVRSGSRALRECLEFYAIDLGDACKASDPALRAKSDSDRAAFAAACGEETRALCPESAGGWTVQVKCLTLHDDALSRRCRDYGIALRRRMEARMTREAEEACAEDAARLCPDLTLESGLAACLRRGESRLTPRCRGGLRVLNRAEQLKRVEKSRERDGARRPAP
ncbi:MAG TPA: hypothetical protein VN915_14010 [Elusimicrobiota bacterium]|nr:hypothetical protein [Elusimicrobiota bacterium]